MSPATLCMETDSGMLLAALIRGGQRPSWDSPDANTEPGACWLTGCLDSMSGDPYIEALSGRKG